jgi:rhodanese-related sulfurtransferase
MKKLSVIILFSLPMMIWAQDCKKTDAKTFDSEVKKGDCTVLDVRTEREFNGGHLANATNIDFYGDDFRESILKLDKTKPVLVYCYGGGRSSEACDVLAAHGFVVIELEEGIKAWKEQGLPVEK